MTLKFCFKYFYQELLPEGSIVDPILLNIFINKLLLFINEAGLANFPDDHTIYGDNQIFVSMLDCSI